jgi:hypothetical protein
MLRYLSHALEALAKRGLKQEWAEEAIATPDWTEPDPDYPGRIRAYKRIGALDGRILRVVYWYEGADIVVLTIYPDRDAGKRRILP